MARDRTTTPAADAGNDARGRRGRDRCVRSRVQRVVRPQRPRSRAVGRDACSDPANGGHPGVRGRCERSPAAGRIGGCSVALVRPAPHPGPARCRPRAPPRPPPWRGRPDPGRHEPSGRPGPIRRDRARPLVPGDRSDDRDVSVVEETCDAFAAAGFHQRRSSRCGKRTRPASRISSTRWTHSVTPTRRCANSPRTSSAAARSGSVGDPEQTGNPEPRSNWLDLLVLRAAA